MIQTLEGMRDTLECADRRKREAALVKLFAKRGFQEVSTPVLERYELFACAGCPLSEEKMIKTIGRDGRICVLRPDNTAPIARLAATRLKNELPLKLFYTQPVYLADGSGIYETQQAGVEIIGSKVRNHTVLDLAIKAVERYYGQTPHIEVSHAAILKNLPGEALALIKRKNFAELGDEFPNDAALLKLVRISGGLEAINEAEQIVGSSRKDAFAVLRTLLKELPDKNLSVDFGLAPPLGYYTGVFFRGYVNGISNAVLSGGRYNHLMGQLGHDAPAVGFAINME
jgi:ATP phosphoribosyltransferase regulatory subunit